MKFEVGDTVIPTEQAYKNWKVIKRLSEENANLVGTIIGKSDDDYLVQFDKEYQGLHRGGTETGKWVRSDKNDCYFFYEHEISLVLKEKISLEEML